MNDLERRLDDLAQEAKIPPLDLAQLHSAADRQGLRRRLVVSGLAVAVATCGVGGVAVVRGDSGERLTTITTPAAGRQAPAPSAQRLRDVLSVAFPDVPSTRIEVIPAGPFGPDRSVFGGPGRALVADAVATVPYSTVRAIWYAVNTPLTDEEADDLARGVFRPDPDPLPAPVATAFDVSNKDSVGSSVRTAAYAWDGKITALSWSADGGIAQVQLPGSSRDTATARAAADATRALLDPKSVRADDPRPTGTPARPTPAGAQRAAAPRLPLFELARVPDGYGKASVLSDDDVDRGVQYLPTGRPNAYRISLVATRTPPSQYLEMNNLSPAVRTTTIRNGLQATEHAYGPAADVHSRHCLIWQERPGVLLALYAYESGAALDALAEEAHEIRR